MPIANAGTTGICTGLIFWRDYYIICFSLSVLKQYRNLRSRMLWVQAMKDLKDAEEDFIIADIHPRKAKVRCL